MELFESKHEGILSIRTLLYVALIFFAFVLMIAKAFGRDPKHVKFASLLSGPTPLPIFGNSLQLLMAKAESPEKLMSYWSKKYGSIYRLWLANNLVIVVSDVDYVKGILNNRNAMWLGPFYEEVYRFFSDYDMTHKQAWKMLRSLRSHFSPEAMKSLVPILNKRTAQLMDYLHEKSGSEFDIDDTIFDTSFDMFTSTQFDYVMDSKSKKRFDYRSKFLKMKVLVMGLPLLVPGMRTKFVRYLTEYIFVKPLKKAYYSYIRMMTNGIMSSFREDDEGKSTNLEHHKLSYLWTFYEKNLLVLNPDVTKRNFEPTNDLSGGVIQAAVESSYLTMSHALLMIAMHSSVQDKLYEEIYEVFGDDQRQADYEDIGRLSYMEQVINETMRCYVPPFFFRYVSQDTRIGPYIVPQGTQIIVDGLGIHTNAKFYPRPLEFNPDNFNEEMVAKRPPHSFIAFGAGTRECIGEKFARTEIKLVLLEILRKFIVRTSLQMDGIKYYTRYGLGKSNKFPLRFESRQSTDKIKRCT